MTLSKTLIAIGLLAASNMSLTSACGAQRSSAGPELILADSSPARIMSVSSTGINTLAVVDVLRQRYKTHSPAKRRELSDSLVARAIRGSGDAVFAITAISMAGSADPGEKGIADRGALDRLIQIHREATKQNVRQDALNSIIDQIEVVRAVPYVKSVATSNAGFESFQAILLLTVLADERGPYGTAAERADVRGVLDQLVEQRAVKGTAWSGLCEFARMKRLPHAGVCPSGG